MAYDHQSIEQKWQAYWEREQTFRAERHPDRPKYFVLDMFPYPSGQGLHVGHPVGYTASDIVARYKRMRGFDVLHPMGWDAFGLPAEQHAIKTGTHPKETTLSNIATFKRQLKSLGFSFDWSREINTTDPEYFRCTQWIFLQLFKRGLAFQSSIPVNWCPALGTVLANEEVQDGVSEVGKHPVVRQPLRQWQLKITEYADRLALDLEGLDWPETREKQRDWIGRSEGAEIDFRVQGSEHSLRVYTTRPDTLYGATYLVMAPDHPLALEICAAAQRPALEAYREEAARKSDLERTAATKDKTGVSTGAYAIHPLTGDAIPIYSADYVLGAYGTGAIMAVPAHDSRDFDFARAHDLPIVEVVSPDGTEHDALDEAYTESGIAVRSGVFTGLPTAEMQARIIAHLEELGAGHRQVNYKLRDWVFSRQRYWGEPIPIYFPVETDGDPRTGAPYTIDYETPLALDEDELPLVLPELTDFRPSDDPQGPLARVLDWRFFQREGKWFARETNTMPQWAGSCWYYLRYLDPHNPKELCSKEAYDAWMPVDLYVGGAEHAVLHLLYARFWHKVLFDLGVVSDKEPFRKLVHQGHLLGQSFCYYMVVETQGDQRVDVRALPGHHPVRSGSEKGTWVTADTGERVERRFLNQGIEWRESKPYHPEYGVLLDVIAEKMSKSRGNVVNPDDIVREQGADALRVYEMFLGPLERTKPWQSQGIVGVRTFLDKVVAAVSRHNPGAPLDEESARQMHRTTKKCTEDIEGLRFNTAISQLMIFTNHLLTLEAIATEPLERLVLCLAPLAPHLGEELWEQLGHSSSVAMAAWPAYDEAMCVDAVVTVPVQLNGKVRGRVVLPADAGEEEAKAAAEADPKLSEQLAGKTIRKVVYVPGRILNLIVS